MPKFLGKCFRIGLRALKEHMAIAKQCVQAGNGSIAMMAITTNNSISVNPFLSSLLNLATVPKSEAL